MTAAVQLPGCRALVTGGAGTIGSHVVDELIAAGAAEVVVLDNLSRGRVANLANALETGAGRVRLVEGDVRDRDLVHGLTRGTDVVFHLAALRITQCAAEPRLALDSLVGGTFTVAEAAAEHGVQKVVLSSTASVYGAAEVFPTSERHHPYNNDTFYGAAKSFNEATFRSFKAMYDLDHVVLRYFNVYGPRMDVHGRYTEVLIRWIERIAAGDPPLVLGDGLQTMDFVHVADIARANLAAASAGVTDEVFNIGRGEETSLLELAELLLTAMGSDLDPVHGEPRGVTAVPRRLADVRRAREVLGWEARIDMAEGLRDLVTWWRDDCRRR